MQNNWLSEAYIYHILIDRFYGESLSEPEKPHFAGGTIAGIIEKIDYIKSLGVNCIWISPFYKGISYHGYHITDYYSVDEHFGTIGDLEKLIAVVHQNGMKLIADLVPNHCSTEHPFFIDAKTNKKSKYRKWFCFNESTGEYLSFLGFKELAKINLDEPEARRYFIDNARFWLSKGLDGFRIDHVIGVSRSFLTNLSSELKAINPSAKLIGEAWIEGIRKTHFNTMRIKNTLFHKHFGISQEKVQQQYEGLLDGVLDFEARNIILQKYLGEDKSEDEVLTALQKHFRKYKKDYSLVQFLDNHDTNRIMFECGNDSKKVKKMFSVLKKCKQPIVIYSGTEQALTHKESIFSGKPYADLDVRQPMDWKTINKEHE
jgi:glycosidase